MAENCPFETVTNTGAKRLFVYKTPLKSAQLSSRVLYLTTTSDPKLAN